LWTFELQI